MSLKYFLGHFRKSIKTQITPVHAAFLVYAVVLLLISLLLVNPQWDEYLDFAGCVGAANHLLAILRGYSTDISTITSDLEWYGNGFRWPAYLLWVAQAGFPVQIHDGPLTYDHFLLSGFSSSIHIVAALYAVLGVYFYWKILSKLSLTSVFRWASVLSFSCSPFWLGNAVWNLKDLPIAVSVLAIQFASLLPWSESRHNGRRELISFWLTAFALSLILSSKYAYLPLVLLLSLTYCSSRILMAKAYNSNAGIGLSFICSPLILRQLVVKTLFLSLIAFSLSFLLTPQVFGNPLYPLRSIQYFAAHPVVNVNRLQAINFFVSRLSYLLTPVLWVVSLLGITACFRLLLRARCECPGRLDIQTLRKLIVLSFGVLPFMFAVLPVLIAGRTFYGPDLRHVIWVYPSALLALFLLADSFCRRSYGLQKILLNVLVLSSLSLTLVETAIIFPHFYSYLGLSPYHLVRNLQDHRLILSRYLPGSSPELHRDMFLSCAQSDQCQALLDSIRDSSPVDGVASFSFPINPDYYKAYLRLGQAISTKTLYPLLGYELTVREAGICSEIKYSREWPSPIHSSLTYCPVDEQ